MASTRELIDLAERARRYEPDALSELFDMYFERLRRYLYYKTGDLDRAEDLASEALTTGLEKIAKFKDRGGTIGAWLFGIARNVLARDREYRGRAEAVGLEEELAAPDDAGPEPVVVARLTNEELYRALARLPEEQREVVLLRFMEGFDSKETGRVMGKRPGAVRALQFRAVKALQEIFERRGVES